jgi:uncharacterized protein YegJ (DUF2314 family)
MKPIIFMGIVLVVGAVLMGLLWIGLRPGASTSSTGRSNEPLVSLVLLLRQPRQPSEATVHAAAERAFGVKFGRDPSAGDFVDTLQKNMFPVGIRGSRLGVIYSSAKYFDNNPAAAARFSDPALRDAVNNHQGWVSVDWFGPLDPGDRPKAYQQIGRLLAELAGDDCLAVFSTERGQLRIYDGQSKKLMRGRSPIDAFVDDVPVTVGDNDPKLNAGMAEARRRWPEFVAAFGGRKPNDHFSAKARFIDGDHVEYMWMTVTSISGDSVRGTLDNEPSIVNNVKYGQPTSFRLTDLNDWLYKDATGMHGGFTIPAVEAARGGSNAQNR